MSDWHLHELEEALSRRGWRIVAKLPGDDYRVSETWQLERGNDPRSILIDFDGLDDMHTLPVERSYGCQQRGTQNALYFRRRGANPEWATDLARFVMTIEN